MPIPLIIHQTWKTKNLTPRESECTITWQKMNPEFRYCLYDDDDCEALVRRYFPQYLKHYQKLEKPVEKADLFRYMVIYVYGGVYADIDTVCLRPLSQEIPLDCGLVVGKEHETSYWWLTKLGRFTGNLQYCQFFFAAEPRHPGLLAVIQNIIENIDTVYHEDTDINTLEKTGPGIFTKTLLLMQHLPSLRICVLDLHRVNCTQHCACKHKRSILYHKLFGTWKVTTHNYKQQLVIIFIVLAVLGLLITWFLWNRHKKTHY